MLWFLDRYQSRNRPLGDYARHGPLIDVTVRFALLGSYVSVRLSGSVIGSMSESALCLRKASKALLLPGANYKFAVVPFLQVGILGRLMPPPVWSYAPPP